MDKRIIVLLGVVLIGVVIGASLLLTGRAVVTRVRATPRPTPLPKAGANVVPTPAAKTGSTPAPEEAKLSSLEQEVKGLANQLGFETFDWKVLAMPVSTTSAEVLAYYTGEMQKQGWNGKVNTYTDPEGHLVGAWTESDYRNGLVIVYLASTSGSPVYVITISGQGPPFDTPTPELIHGAPP